MGKRFKCYNKIISIVGGIWCYHEWISLGEKAAIKKAGLVWLENGSIVFVEHEMSVAAISILMRIHENYGLQEVTLKELQKFIINFTDFNQKK
jgi:hypothetical protein